jgi:type 1 glutamine amidotransferase/cytochrome c551/c552
MQTTTRRLARRLRSPVEAKGTLSAILLLVFLLTPAAVAAQMPADKPPAPDLRVRRILLIAGPLDGGHPAGTHEYEKTVLALKDYLGQSNVAARVRVDVVLGGWPEDPALLEQADTILLFSNGGDRNEQDHPLLVGDRWEVLRRQMDRGCGLILLHWATFLPDKKQDDTLEWLGGYFDYQEGPGPQDWYSRIRHATAIVQPGDKDHPICCGLSPFKLADEYYYRMRFRDGDPRLRPILRVAIPEEEQEQVVAWAVERNGGGRGFAFTGCHFLNSLDLPGFRRLLLNALVWTAGLDIPDGGVALDSERPVKAIIVTGQQHPAHVWRETTLALEDLLRKDERLQVESVPDPEFLAEPRLHDYDVVIFNYCNWQQPEGLSEAAKQNFVEYLKSGGGLVLIHFSNGAFHFSLPDAATSDWPEWRENICRRVWDHTAGKSGHDAYGPFRVDIRDDQHPLTAGLESFDTSDELYFRQQGQQPIRVLATARSQVTGQDEPMAFVYSYGKGQVFQTVLGHSVESLRTEGTQELVRRAVAWTAGRNPLATASPRAASLIEGRFGKALDARRGSAEIEHQEAYQQWPLTVECWVQLFSKEHFNIFVAKNPKSSARHWELYSYAGTGEFSAFLPGFQPAEIKTGVALADGQWHHVAMTFDGSRLRLHVDGDMVRQEFLRRVSENADSGPLWFGAYPPGNIGCDGLVDEVRISRIIRDVSGVPQQAPQTDDDTVGLWRFDASENARVRDESKLSMPAVLTALTPDAVDVTKAEDHFEGFDESHVVDDRWQQAETGRFFCSSIRLPEGTPTWKSIVVRVGSKGEASVCYDTELLRVSGAWPGFLKFSNARFGLIEMPQPAGAVSVRSAMLPGYAKDGDFRDPRARAPYGSLPKNWAHYRGLYLHDERVVLSYSVGDVAVLESPWYHAENGAAAFTRTLHVGPAAAELRMLICGRTTAAIVSGETAATIEPGIDEHWVLVVPPSPAPRILKVWCAAGAQTTAETLRRWAAEADLEDVLAWTHPGAARWTQPIVTQGQRADDDTAYVVDTLTLPYDNPYRALMFTSGHDFFPNGDAAVCTAHGDVWRVSGIDEDLQNLQWKRMATGLFQPLGLKIIDGRVWVTCRDQITVLHDQNQDGEADYFENFNNDAHVSANGHEYATCLERDSQGYLYFLKGDSGGQTDHDGCLLRVSPDGQSLQIAASGIRNGNGLAIGPGDVITASPQEGNWTPASSILEIKSGGFYGMMDVHHRADRPVTFDPPLCWLPRLMDNSSGGQVWAPAEGFGPLSGHLLHFSFGRCRMLLILREVIDGQAQAAALSLPIEFLSGAMRGRFHERDGHLYVTGLRGWVTSAVRDGCFQRVRYVGGPVRLPIEQTAHANGIRLRFDVPLDRTSAENIANYTIEAWNYRWSAEYGSFDYRPSDPKRRGRDEIYLRSATLLDDGASVFLEIPDLRPVMQLNITYSLQSSDHAELRSATCATIHRLGPAFPLTASASSLATAPQLLPELRQHLRPGLRVTYERGAGELLERDLNVLRLAAWHVAHTPSSGISPGPYRAKAEGWLRVNGRQSARFRVQGNGSGARLSINGLRILDAVGPDLARFVSAATPLQPGWNRLELEYHSPDEGGGQLRLLWAGESFIEEPVPASALFRNAGDSDLATAERLRDGRRVFTEFRCDRCHASAETVQGAIADDCWPQSQAGPNLAAAGDRFQGDWLYHWLLAPDQLRNDATMPRLLSDGEPGRQDAQDITAYLLSLRTPRTPQDEAPAAGDRGELARLGHELFETLGCIACHRLSPPATAEALQRVSLAFAGRKLNVQQLAEFLRRPQAHYQDTRMPDFQLSADEATALAVHLVDRAAQLPHDAWSGGDAVRGARRFRELRCSACHETVPHAVDGLTQDRPAIPFRRPQQGCLTATPPLGGVPNFSTLSNSQRDALIAWLSTPARPQTDETLAEQADYQIARLRCTACHERDDRPAEWPELLLSEGDLGLVPEPVPSLTWTGDKLHSDWTRRLLAGQLAYRPRPWLRARMPAFPAVAARLADGLAASHGRPPSTASHRGPSDVPAATWSAEKQRAADVLLDKNGLDCRQCHAPAGEILDTRNQAQGIGLAYMRERLTHEYYQRWMFNPLRIDATTKMPQFTTDGATTKTRQVLNGDAQAQFELLWEALGHLPPPSP